MTGVLVTFTQTRKFDRSGQDRRRLPGNVRRPAGPSFKCLTLDDEGLHARNFYLWEDEETRAFFTEELARG